MNIVYTIAVVITLCDITLSDNETLNINDTAINSIMTSNIPVNISQIDDKMVDSYLFRDINLDDEPMDFSDLDPYATKVAYETAHSKLQMVETEVNKSRRWYSEAAFNPNPYFERRTIDLMKQSLYATRYRLNDTRHIRKMYSKDPTYNIAILYGSLMQIRSKMESMYGTLNTFEHKKMKFIWYIVLYEKCLAASVDVEFMVHRIFELATKLKNVFKESEYGGGGDAPLPDAKEMEKYAQIAAEAGYSINPNDGMNFG